MNNNGNLNHNRNRARLPGGLAMNRRRVLHHQQVERSPEELERIRIEQEERRIQQEYFPMSNIFESPDYDRLLQHGDVESYLAYLPKWLQMDCNNDACGIWWRIIHRPSQGLTEEYLSLITQMSRLFNENIQHGSNNGRGVPVHVVALPGMAAPIIERFVTEFTNARILTLGGGPGSYNNEPPTQMVATGLRGLQQLKFLAWDLTDTPSNDIISAIISLPKLESLRYYGCPTSTLFQDLFQKESLKRIILTQTITTEEQLLAITEGLTTRKESLEHVSFTIDELLVISSWDRFLVNFGLLLAKRAVESAMFSVKDESIFEFRRDRDRHTRLAIRMIIMDVIIATRWEEWLPSLCTNRRVTSLGVLGFDGGQTIGQLVVAVASEIQLECLEIDATDEYLASSFVLDLTTANHLKRFVIGKDTRRFGKSSPQLILDGDFRFKFRPTLQELVLNGHNDRESIRVTLNYVVDAMMSLPRTSQLVKLEGTLPDGYYGMPLDVRKSIQRTILNLAWPMLKLEMIMLIGVQKTGVHTGSGPIRFDEELDTELECLLNLNKAGRSYMINPKGANFWSAAHTLASAQKLLSRKPELRPDEIYYHIRENPSLFLFRTRS